MLTVYTAIFGTYDGLKEPLFVPDGVEFVCYTDQASYLERSGSVWKIELVDSSPSACPVRSARYFKTHPPQGDSLWIDASIEVLCNINKVMNSLFGLCGIISCQHPRRTHLKDEYQSARARAPHELHLINAQEKNYLRCRHHHSLHLHATGILYRQDTPLVRKFNNAWWDQIEKYSTRDQLSFSYLIHVYKFPTVHFPIGKNLENNSFFKLHKHLKVDSNAR